MTSRSSFLSLTLQVVRHGDAELLLKNASNGPTNAWCLASALWIKLSSGIGIFIRVSFTFRHVLTYARLAKMIALVEAHQSWLETITYQMCNMPYKQQAQHLAGPIGLLKMSVTRAAHEIADEAVQMWGGRGLTQTGMGKHIEMFNRTYKFDAILGGEEAILGDLGVRQALKNFPKAML